MNNDNIIRRLQAGETIPSHREGGNSMLPVIKSRQPVTLQPIVNPELLKADDIVLCKVNGRRYLHFIGRVTATHVQIQNYRGFVNGWTVRRNIYGIVTAIDGKTRTNSQYGSVTVQV